MRGTGESAGSQSRTCSKRNTLKRCKNNGVADNVVLIDVDSDNIDNVIIIDVPESLKQKLRGSSVLRKEKKFQFGTVICIDDDMSSDDESSDIKHPGTNVEGDGDFSSVASSSGRFFPASNHIRNSVNAVGDEFVQEIFSPLKLSKCKRTYSGKASSRNCYGLGPESHSGSSDNDCPDYDFMEDSSGELRELWEKANMKKKYEACNGQSGRCNQATASELRAGTPQDVEVENMTDQHTEADIRPSSRNAGFEKENSSPFLQTDVGSSGSTYNNSKNTPLANFGLMSTQETQSNADNWVRAESLPVDPPFNNADGETTHCGKHGGSSFWDEEEHCSQGPSFCFSHKQGSKQVNHTNRFSQDKVKTISSESCISNSEPTVDINFGCGKTSLPDEEASSRTKHDDMEDVGRENFWQTACCNSHFSNEFENGRSSLDKEKLVHGKPSEPTADINFGCGKASLTDEAASVDMEDVGRENVWQTTCCNSHFSNEFENGSSSSLDKEKLVHGETSFQNIKLSGRTQESHGGVDNAVGAGPGETFCENPPLGKSGLEKEKGCCQDKVKPFLEVPSFFIAPRNEAHTDLNMGARELAGEFMSNPQHEEKDSPFHAQDGTVVNAVQGYVISNREKLKETDEYKRAVEEEWASRQRVLQLQAEESQKLRLLRKRKKAESMRLLDMERRQKQRVEEMREVQKKDEENLNLKEQLRAEVRKELNQLESTCRNMASLLRGLGIQVGGGSHPLPHEVRAAYKRALLRFHPDRASGSDIRQLVEAEEKFKLISRMKEKFLLTS